MAGVEDLVDAVQDDRSRRYLAEAVHAYQAGAHRPAIIAIWVAVALDLVAKIRELADDGDGAARAFVASIDGRSPAVARRRCTRSSRGSSELRATSLR
jgi:hypothetical protein